MKLKQVLNKEVVTTDLQGSTKREIIEELLDILMNTGKVADRSTALKDLLDREAKMSTGIQHGVAIPHAKTKAVTGLVACIGVHREGMDFESLDGVPSTIFVMTLSPENRTGPHVQFLAEISMVLKSPPVRSAIMKVTDPGELLELFGA